MIMHDVVQAHELAHRPEDLVARVLAVGTVAICLLGFAFAIAGADRVGQPAGGRDSAQVLNYSD